MPRGESNATAAPSSPAPTGTQKLVEAPERSTTSPARAAPGARPAPSPVVNSVMPSVIRPAGTVSSIQANAAINVGEIAKPDRNRNAARDTNPPTKGSGSISSPSASIPRRNRTGLPARNRTAPTITPETRLPTAQTPSISPDREVAPSSSDSATVATSAPPRTAPIVTALAISGASTGHGIGARPCP